MPHRCLPVSTGVGRYLRSVRRGYSPPLSLKILKPNLLIHLFASFQGALFLCIFILPHSLELCRQYCMLLQFIFEFIIVDLENSTHFFGIISIITGVILGRGGAELPRTQGAANLIVACSSGTLFRLMTPTDGWVLGNAPTGAPEDDNRGIEMMAVSAYPAPPASVCSHAPQQAFASSRTRRI